MTTSATLDNSFIQRITPVLSEFGFSGIRELVTDQVTLMLQSRIDHFEAEDRLYASRFGQSYEQMILSHATQAGSEDYELDDVLNDWRFARESATLYRSKMQHLLSA